MHLLFHHYALYVIFVMRLNNLSSMYITVHTHGLKLLQCIELLVFTIMNCGVTPEV